MSGENVINYDYSWEALTKPGEANRYFDWANPSLLQTVTTGFNASNAWWLAEISRLVYHENFHKDDAISFGCFEFEKIGFIDHKPTTTKAAILKVSAIDNDKNKTPCIVLAFRGSDEVEDWHLNIHTYQIPFSKKGLVHAGFKTAYLSIKKELYQYLKDNTYPLFITGHSLGAALATLATAELFKNENFDSCYTFGSPRVGNSEFVHCIDTDRIFRIVNNLDVVTLLPLDFTIIQYQHLGQPHLFKQEEGYVEGLSDDEIYEFQKQNLQDLKNYAKENIFNNNIKNIRSNIPPFLADHAPINYTTSLQKLLIHR